MKLYRWSLTAGYTVPPVPTDKDLIVLGIRESCYPVQAAEFKSDHFYYSLWPPAASNMAEHWSAFLAWWTKWNWNKFSPYTSVTHLPVHIHLLSVLCSIAYIQAASPTPSRTHKKPSLHRYEHSSCHIDPCSEFSLRVTGQDPQHFRELQTMIAEQRVQHVYFNTGPTPAPQQMPLKFLDYFYLLNTTHLL